MKKNILFLAVILFSCTVNAKSKLEKALQRKLIVVTENCNGESYPIIGIPDNDSFYKDLYSRLWKFHKDIAYMSCDSARKIITTSDPTQYSIIRTSLSLEKRPGGTEWYNIQILGLFLAEEFAIHPEIINTKTPVAEYRFTGSKIYVEEMALAVKFLSDYLECEINKVNCDVGDEVAVNKAKLKSKILVINEDILFKEAREEITKGIFPCQVLVLNHNEFWNKLLSEPDKYAFLGIAAHKFGKPTTRYYLVDAKDFKILGYDTPGGMEFLGQRYVEKKRIGKIARIYEE